MNMTLAMVFAAGSMNLKKIPVSLRLENDIVLYFKKLASEQKVSYQILINALYTTPRKSNNFL
ncbi:MAG: BrnA antitoxin family protein [Sulfurimonas sp.]|nr:BrnA antitoxin family protein [Sulfurimonas sp.]